MRDTKKHAASKAKRNVRDVRAPVRATILALPEPQNAPVPRARIRLRASMRKAGLDEWKIGWLLNYKIDCVAESNKSSDNKLLLEYLKEAIRHLDPATARAAIAQETPAIELVHNVPRPDRAGLDEQ